jgi:hypothetical protein
VRGLTALSLPTPGAAELRLAGHAGGILAVTAVPVLAGAYALEGMPGLLGAGAGVALVGVLFGVAGLVQAYAARRKPSSMITIIACGLGVRLACYLAALQLLGGVDGLHRPSLAVATAIAFMVTLQHEMRLINRTPELFWVDARPAQDGEDADGDPAAPRMKRS